jgi:cell division septation protein DedD
MDIKFNKDAEDGPRPNVVEEKGKQNVLLVVLLILVAGFGYIYFFTGLIKPAPEQKVAEAPPVPQVVKKPLPSPDGKPANQAEDGSEAKTDAAAPVKAEPVKPAPAPAPAANPATQQADNSNAEQKKAETPQSSVRKPLPSVGKAGEKKAAPVEKKQAEGALKQPLPTVAKAEEKKPAPTEKKQAEGALKKPLPPKGGEKKSVEVKKPVEKTSVRVEAPTRVRNDAQKSAQKEPAAPGNPVVPGRWTVQVGNFVLEEAMATDLAQVRKAGFNAFVVPGTPKKTHMNRLLLGEFTDRAAAQVELDKLKRHTSDAFIIDSGGMHVVCAGSYLLDSRASSEKQRLAAAGFVLTLKRVDVAIPSENLTAGSFVDKKEAEDILKKLRAAGIKATLSH